MSANFPKKVLSTKFDWYVAITRGGLLYAFLLSQLTNQKNIDTFVAYSYDENHVQHDLKINLKDYSHLRGKKVLLIDDLADTGNTFGQVKKILEEDYGAEVKTFAFIKKEGSKFIPDYVCKTTPKGEWIYFKYDNFTTDKFADFVLDEGRG